MNASHTTDTFPQWQRFRTTAAALAVAAGLFAVVTHARAVAGVTWETPIVDKPTCVLYPCTGYTSMYGDQNMVEHFTLATPTTIGQVSWTGFFSSGLSATPQYVVSFDILLFANDPSSYATTAGGVLVSGLPYYEPFYKATFDNLTGISTGLTNYLHGGTVYQWTANIPGLALNADKYWIDIRSSSTENDYFIWSNSLSSDGYQIWKPLADTFAQCDPSTNSFCNPANRAQWIVNDETRGQAFSVAPIPEPSTYALMLVGLAAVCFAARRRKPRIDQLTA